MKASKVCRIRTWTPFSGSTDPWKLTEVAEVGIRANIPKRCSQMMTAVPLLVPSPPITKMERDKAGTATSTYLFCTTYPGHGMFFLGGYYQRLTSIIYSAFLKPLQFPDTHNLVEHTDMSLEYRKSFGWTCRNNVSRGERYNSFGMNSGI